MPKKEKLNRGNESIINNGFHKHNIEFHYDYIPTKFKSKKNQIIRLKCTYPQAEYYRL